jgi:hypothetical protein
VYNGLAKTLAGRLTGAGAPHEIEAALDAVLTYVIQFGNVPNTSTQDRTAGFLSVLPVVLMGRALAWWYEQMRAGVVWASLDAFAEAYRAQFCRQVRFKKQDARMQLRNGEIRQGDRDVQSYTLRFKRAIQLAGDMSLTDQIFWFLDGLRPELLDKCATDTQGRPWTSLDALIEYAFGVEMALKAATKARVSRATAAPAQSTHPTHQSDMSNGAGPSRVSKKCGPPPDGPPPSGGGSGSKRGADKPAQKFKGNPDEKSNWKPHLTIRELQRRRDSHLCYTCGVPLPNGNAKLHDCPHKNNPK